MRDQFGAMFEWTLIIRIKKKNEHQEELEFIRNAITPWNMTFDLENTPKMVKTSKNWWFWTSYFSGFLWGLMRPGRNRLNQKRTVEGLHCMPLPRENWIDLRASWRPAMFTWADWNDLRVNWKTWKNPKSQLKQLSGQLKNWKLTHFLHFFRWNL